MNEKTIRRSLKTIGTLYGLYGAVALMTLAGSIWTGMKLGREGISQFIDIANIPWTLVLLGHLLLPFMAFVCFGIAYAFLNLKNWGHQLAIALNFVMCVLLMC
ncbi:MAG TPA: hypothetical protein VFR82_06400, partial [Nitrospira sp.]|nr:hypothetical protein [Nitrospira sp.]